MKIHDLKPAKGAKKKKQRIGRGNAAKGGTYATRGMKGQRARSGASFYPGFEGGRTPLVKQIPKLRGFKSLRPAVEIVNVGDLSDRIGKEAKINKKKLVKAGLIKSARSPVKLLGGGEISQKVEIIVDACSASAKKAVEKAGGKVVVRAEKKAEKKDSKESQAKKSK